MMVEKECFENNLPKNQLYSGYTQDLVAGYVLRPYICITLKRRRLEYSSEEL